MFDKRHSPEMAPSDKITTNTTETEKRSSLFIRDSTASLYSTFENEMAENKQKLNWFTVYLTFMAAVGGFLFGYDTGVISGALLLIRDDLKLTDFQQESVVSVTTAGAVLGCFGGGYVNPKYGRRPSILSSAIIFVLGAFMMCFAPGFEILVCGRFVVGLGIGLISHAVPMYISETAPSQYRGLMVQVNTLLITGGQFIAGMTDGVFSTAADGWRIMLGLSAVPAALMVLGFLPLPESPRWLCEMQPTSPEAFKALRRLRENTEVTEVEIQSIQKDIMETNAINSQELMTTGQMLRTKPIRRALTLGCVLMLLNQLTGINTVMYYAATIYNMAGFGTTSSIWLSGFTTLAQFVGVILGSSLVEKVGRRPLLLFSLAMVTISLFALGGTFYLTSIHSQTVLSADSECASISNFVFGTVAIQSCYQCVAQSGCGYCASSNTEGTCVKSLPDFTSNTCDSSEFYTDHCTGGFGHFAVAAMIAYLLFFGIGMSGLPWTLTAEIYPLQVRSVSTSLSTGVNWGCNLFVSATFLTLCSPSYLDRYGAFWLYSSIGVVGWIWLYFNLPETKGLTLEEISNLFEDDAPIVNSSKSKERQYRELPHQKIHSYQTHV